jgi:dynein heavy chain
VRRSCVEDAKDFNKLDQSWKKFMFGVFKGAKTKYVLVACTGKDSETTTLNMFTDWNLKLEKIQKHLEDYLETKRRDFPRFYFLSNDELLHILASSEARSVEKHINKCFDNICRLGFKPDGQDIIALYSGEGEELDSIKINTKPETTVWMG